MRAEDVRRWVNAHRAAASHEHLFAGTAPSPEVSWRQALSLIALVGRMVGWPVEPDAIRRREDESAAQTWLRLRAACGRRP